MTELAINHRLPGMFGDVEYVEAGGLSYRADLLEQFRRSAFYIDRILKGTSPADLPVELPTKFTLAINLRTAKTIGLTIPESFLLRADKVIE
jgi:putative ABC transport system substrate-binding protein